MEGLVHWGDEVPELRRPVLLVALDGFIDAGSAAETAATFLRHRWQSEVVARFDRDAFLDYRARRPTVLVDSGVLRKVSWPDLELLTASVDGAAHDAAFLIGPEPDSRWEAFCAAVLDASRALEVQTVIALGAYPAAVPHTRPIRITGARNLAAGDLLPDVIPVPGYTGPVGASTVLQHALADAGIPAMGLWAEVPHYISATPNPYAALALVKTVATAFGVAVNTDELEAAAKAHRSQVDEAVAEHPDAGAMISALERHLDSGEADGDLPSGDDLAAEIERFLRSQAE